MSRTSHRYKRCPQAGAALISAMLTVSLVASLAAAALAQQWRLSEVERHERQRQQAQWILQGALDWARLILREDAPRPLALEALIVREPDHDVLSAFLLAQVREGLQGAGITLASADITMLPKTTVETGEKEARQLLRLLDDLEDNDDVQDVYANFDISEEVMEAVAS